MSRTQKTYFLLPTTDHAPSTPSSPSTILLGAIISSPHTPYQPISPPYEPLPPIHKAWKTNYTFSLQKSTSGSFGLCGAFLAQLGSPLSASAAGTASRYDDQEWCIKKLETEFIQPDATYVESSVLGVEAVKRFLEEKKRFGMPKPVYMVTGIKIARGASLGRMKKRVFGAEGEVMVDGTMIKGVPFSAGPKGSMERATKEEESFEDCSDFIFAYRLQKIFVQWRSKKVESEQVTGGQLVGLDDEVDSAEEEESDDDEDQEISMVKLEDWDFGSDYKPAQFTSAVVKDEEGEECQALLPLVT
ncbi:hypothetical protein GQ43DRAFT_485133 [Delitschia confertaspora ATCC 74209]|uniref:Uncharacterized protein n=1 Tax=Delitschia confertaspora ATCC 74209 TaxID=1513339 RepID=A0A9P4JFB9_9PLEO|nr:hypothetical protein GQ43DRAFT_485133 [Delitschia confertaspora ATCC 74209]